MVSHMKTPSHARPLALAIGGSDSSGGAGIQADLKVWAVLGIHGASAITCITAQSPGQVSAVMALTPAMVREQLNAVARWARPDVVKTGMLYSTAIIETVADWVAQTRPRAVVVDPVMVAAGGELLVKPRAVSAMAELLVPLATIFTPNLCEARWLLGNPRDTNPNLTRLAQQLFERLGRPVLLKGGHLAGDIIENVVYDGQRVVRMRTRRVRNVTNHGAGCMLASAVAGELAYGQSVHAAVRRAVHMVRRAFHAPQRFGSMRLPDPLGRPRR